MLLKAGHWPVNTVTEIKVKIFESIKKFLKVKSFESL